MFLILIKFSIQTDQSTTVLASVHNYMSLKGHKMIQESKTVDKDIHIVYDVFQNNCFFVLFCFCFKLITLFKNVLFPSRV